MNNNARRKCEYCTFEGDCGKSFMFQLGFPGEDGYLQAIWAYYISCTTNDTGDKINGIQERNSRDITCCPMCGRKLKMKAWELRIEDSGEYHLFGLTQQEGKSSNLTVKV